MFESDDKLITKTKPERTFKFAIELTANEKLLLDFAIWYQIRVYEIAKKYISLTQQEERRFETYKRIYRKLGNNIFQDLFEIY
jgi:hypothetical protein